MEVLLDTGPRPGRRRAARPGPPRIAGWRAFLTIAILGTAYVLANVVMTNSTGL